MKKSEFGDLMTLLSQFPFPAMVVDESYRVLGWNKKAVLGSGRWPLRTGRREAHQLERLMPAAMAEAVIGIVENAGCWRRRGDASKRPAGSVMVGRALWHVHFSALTISNPDKLLGFLLLKPSSFEGARELDFLCTLRDILDEYLESRSRRHLLFRRSTQGARALSSQQLSVFELVLEGYSNKRIAAETGKTLASVKQEVSAIYKKLGVGCRSELLVKFLSERPTAASLAAANGLAGSIWDKATARRKAASCT